MAHRRDELMTSAPASADRPLGELLADLSRNLGLLVRQEIELAKTEIQQKTSRLAKDATAVGIGAGIAFAGGLALVAALVLLLVRFGVAPWVSALLVGGVILVIGYVLINRAIHDMSHTDLTPRQTAESMKENVQWVKEQVT
jgi:xanthine/uracil permease